MSRYNFIQMSFTSVYRTALIAYGP
ncbi:hypothetical protein VS_II0734 [Vibrio atlanticus]|uniref:Uncharacterized protein n=1 Tax=Vibrio atlanticus (strain LGP32) TaxID=575788 RepID=B7VRY5_VIBA3|nr:hypothetical protein VS_II0734 [Vibrio atlanticus]